nr:MAG TPA: hypothetical protein [Caudoviricetes sp.]
MRNENESQYIHNLNWCDYGSAGYVGGLNNG